MEGINPYGNGFVTKVELRENKGTPTVFVLARLSRNLDDMLQHMEALAIQVWPRVP